MSGRRGQVPRIVFTMSYPERLGGAENFLWALLRLIDRDRFDPALVFLRDGPFVEEVKAIGIPAGVLDAGRHRHVHKTVRVIGALARRFRAERPDLIVNWTPEAQLYAGTAAALAGMRRRVVWWQHGMHGAQWLDPVATAIPAAAIGASSEAGAAEQRLHRPRRATFVVHPGIDEAAPRDPAITRAGLGIPEERVVVGAVGRMHPEKGHHHLIEALAAVREAGQDAHALVVGGTAHGMVPHYVRTLHDRVERLGLGDAVTFTGQVPDASPYFPLMDVLANPCPREGFGIVVLEAMRASLPVVAVQGSGAAEIVIPESTGLLVPPENPAALAAALSALAGDAELRAAYGAAGEERFRSTFTSRHMAEAMQRELGRLAAVPQRPASTPA